jgi:hypothetical protein
MTTAEKLVKVAENEAVIKDAAEQLDLCLKGNKVDGKSWYDEFWDIFITLRDFAYIFAGRMWNDTTFKPKYDITPTNSSTGLFSNNGCSNLKKRFQEQNIKLDLSKTVSCGQGFYYSNTTELPELDLSNCNVVGHLFAYAKVKVIDKITFKDGISFSSVFTNCSALEEIRIGGTISGSDFDIHWSTKLTADSLKSIIQALSTTTTGLTITLPTTAQANYEAVYGTGSWDVLTATRSNWTIAYA